jgi:photosystem II stability/assembly factor-like uncharacterized protein
MRASVRVIAIVLACWISVAGAAEPVDPSLFSGLTWRMIGPFRGGRTPIAVGVPGQPTVYYMGVNNGGVWKSTDFGLVWKPIFDSQPTQSIGALAVAPSNPNVIYVGSGEGLQRPDLSVGDGMYKSTDAGATWAHLGLQQGQQISAIIVDPHDANRLFVAVLGHPYGANEQRGVFRSTDGGQTFQRVLYKDENTGAVDLAFDPRNPQVIYTALWSARQAPWEASFEGPGSGLFKTTDGGNNWRPLTRGLPTVAEGLGRIGFGIAPNDGNRIYALVNAKHGGLFRSDDAGESWTRVNTQGRIWGRGDDFAGVRVDPSNRDILYIANTSTYKSLDAGQTVKAIKGAPGGDDYHSIWINPNDPANIILGADQGATLTVNGGQTWSSWYNQPTAQFYHVITDNQFPYWVYGGQQESGSAGVASRGNDGQITFREWHPVGVEEYGYVAPDPLHPNLIYGGKASRYNMTTGDVQQIAPTILKDGKHRYVRTMPLLFSPVDPHVLYLGSNVIFKTVNGGQTWREISPDLTRTDYEMPPSTGIFAAFDPEKGKHRGVVYTIAPSYLSGSVLWAGTDDGLIHVTRDGGLHWKAVTPPQITPWSKISLMEASHTDIGGAYAAVNRFRVDDLSPYIYRTHDFGNTWQKIVNGLPDNVVVNSVKEDPQRKGLLFAATERGVFVSFSDGDLWQPLQFNLPRTSVRDVVIHGDDLVIGTHGRGFWILDDITPLRQIRAASAAVAAILFKPEAAYRVRRNQNTDTPLPPEEPAGKNPPDGASVNYWLKADATQPVVLEIDNAAGKLVRRYASDDPVAPPETDLNVPTYWIRPQRLLPAKPGMQRFVWDLRYPPPESLTHEYPISAIYGDTPREPLGVLAMPGQYIVKLTVDGQTYSQPLTVKMDPRVKAPPSALLQQFNYATLLNTMLHQSAVGLDQLKQMSESHAATDEEIAALRGGEGVPAARGPGENFTALNGDLATVYNIVESTDSAPTTQSVAAIAALQSTLQRLQIRLLALSKPVR